MNDMGARSLTTGGGGVWESLGRNRIQEVSKLAAGRRERRIRFQNRKQRQAVIGCPVLWVYRFRFVPGDFVGGGRDGAQGN